MKDYAQKRLAKAARAIDAARGDVAAGYSDFAVEHAYYAMFYAAEALLAEHGFHFRSHGAVHGAFGKHFAKTADLDPIYHRHLLDAFEARQLAAYGVDPEITEQQAVQLIDWGREFLQAARAYLGAEGPGDQKP